MEGSATANQNYGVLNNDIWGVLPDPKAFLTQETWGTNIT